MRRTPAAACMVLALGLGSEPLAAQVPTPAKPAPAKPAPAKPAPAPAAPAGGGGRCIFQIDNVDRQGAVNETPTGTNYFAGGNVRLSCRGTSITMQSDSVAAYGGSVVQFIGNVRYRDSTLTMNADRGTYYKTGERWEARGHVETQNLATGSSLSGPSLDYYRALKGVRDTLEMYAVGRPRIKYFESDSTGAKREPYQIVADRVRFKGNDRIWAGGKVTVDRSDFAARSDSMRLDTGKGSDGTLVRGEPVLRGISADSFQLHGRRIDLALMQRELKTVYARGGGHAISRDWDLTADTIAIDLTARKIERTQAWGREPRPYAVSPSYAMRADSLVLLSPGQLLKEVRGYGKAWLGAAIDSATRERDWMRGDTILARFVRADSAGKPRAVLSRIEARSAAQSYHLDRNAQFPQRPSINYVRGDAITVTMASGREGGADRVDVRGQVDGIQLEASSDTSAAPPDSGTAGTPAAPRRSR